MNPISLKFLDQEIEAKFQQAIEDKLKLQSKWLVFSMIIAAFITTIMEIVNQNYVAMGIYTLYLIVFVSLFFALQKNSELALDILKKFNNLNFLAPIVNLLFSMFNIIEFKTGVIFLLTTILYAPMYNQNYNIVRNSIQITISISICICHLSLLIGFTPYYFVIFGPLVQLVSTMYSSIKVERLIFSQSLVNQSLVDIITNVCKENIIIFTYNLEQHKYENMIINETAQQYFNTNILRDILKEIHIQNQQIDTDIQSFVFKNFIQQQQRGEFELHGYTISFKYCLCVNLEQMIANVFRTWNLKYFFFKKQHEIPETIRQLQDSEGSIINSSQIHLELLLHVVALAFRKLLFNYEEFILIELEQYEEIIQLNFYFNSKKHIQKITFLKENLGKLICQVGIQESLSFQENEISFKILKHLNEII